MSRYLAIALILMASPGGLETAIRKMGFELTPARRIVEVLVVTKTN